MERAHYGLQALLYTVALHRYLRWRLRGYDPARHLAGVLYLFVRGMRGAGTPVVWGNVLFVSTAVPVGASEAEAHAARGKTPGIHKYVVMALDRKDGRVVWERVVREDTPAIGLRDGASVGYVLGRNAYPTRAVAQMLVRPCLGAIASLVLLDGTRARFHAATLAGRLSGLREGTRARRRSPRGAPASP